LIGVGPVIQIACSGLIRAGITKGTKSWLRPAGQIKPPRMKIAEARLHDSLNP
jgi:hypothetical protein